MSNHCHTTKKTDYLFLSCLTLCALFITLHFTNFAFLPQWASEMSHATYHTLHKMWWGVVLGIFFVGLLGLIPREFIMKILGPQNKVSGILRATLAGVLLDLCSHGILLIGMKLYERGASLGQTMAFLIASPWNSFSLTIILVTLIGLKWTLTFIVLSMTIAIFSGFVFDFLVNKSILPENPNTKQTDQDHIQSVRIRDLKKHIPLNSDTARSVLIGGFKESRPILRWLLLGVLIAAAMQSFIPDDSFKTYFGPTLVGSFVTLLFATVIEVCSEGLAPVGADILQRANAPGNAFLFLMAGVSTDYTEILSLKETTKSWKIALFLPVVTLPQIFAIALLLNYWA